MEKINMEDFDKIVSNLYDINDESELIETHKILIGKICKNGPYEIRDCGVEFIKKFLLLDFGENRVYSYLKGAQSFIKSKYLSDYFKNSIMELLKDEKLGAIKKTLKGNKLINDMSEKELKEIYNLIKDHYLENKEVKDNISKYFIQLLFKLDGPGVISFIKNNISSYRIANNILLTSGLENKINSGKSINENNLTSDNLVSIFNKLLKLDINYAIDFMEMIMKIEVLNPSNVVNNFMAFVNNKFSLPLDYINKNKIEKYTNGAEKLKKFIESELMKISFMVKIQPTLIKICEYYETLDDESFNSILQNYKMVRNILEMNYSLLNKKLSQPLDTSEAIKILKLSVSERASLLPPNEKK